MPIEEMDTIRESRIVSEYRKIKIGEKGAGERAAPKRYKAPVVTLPLKSRGGTKFDVDNDVMSAIRNEQGKKASEDIAGVPVRLLTDSIDEALYVYRAAYNSFGRALCKSNLGDPKAKRWFSNKDPGEGKGEKKGNFFILHQPNDVDCTKKCEFWPKPGEKTSCSWHCILTVQLVHSPVFPQPTRFRTSGWTVINHLRGSLNKIAAVTGGILANIPLLLVEVEIESRTASGEKRTHPVMEFRFNGTIDQLRDLAVIELNSRRRLMAAIEGKHVDQVSVPMGKLTAGAMSTPAALEEPVGGAEDSDDFVDFDDAEVVGAPAAEAPTEAPGDKESDALMAEIEALRKRASTSDRGYEALVDKHSGDMIKVRDELRKLAGVNKETKQQETKTADNVETKAIETFGGAVDDDWDLGNDSSEPSETVAESKAENKSAPAEPPGDKGKEEPKTTKPKTTSDDFVDDFAMFED